MRCSACCTSSSPAPLGSKASMLACTGGPLRHCQAASASMARSRAPNRRGRFFCRLGDKVGALLRGQGRVGLALRHLHHGAVALGLDQLDALDQRATVDTDGAEDLPEQQRVRYQFELPGVLLAAELELEVPFQAAAVALEHGEEQAALLGGDVLARLLLPALGRAAGDAAVGDAVVLLNGFLQEPEQAVLARQHELAVAG